MTSILVNKMLYAVYTPICFLYAKIQRISIQGISYFCGFPYFDNEGEITIGSNCRFMSKTTGNAIGLYHKCMFSTASKSSILKIGDRCSFSGVSIWCFTSITLGDNVRVGANVTIMDGDAHQDDPRAGKNKPIVIEDNVWLGGNVVVKKGVTIGRNSVIGMNSVVTKNIPANCVAIGNPCVVVKQFEEAKINEIENYFK